MGHMINGYKMLAVKPKWKRPLGRPIRRLNRILLNEILKMLTGVI
jgi:hypothetical protein